MGEVLLVGMALGALGGGWIGYWLGQVRAASRAAGNTYRSVRGKG
ncbi:hypothetical protein SAMN05660199_03595 [Klenkia soli]|uniref:Uncharacterized protein n=1 Tax=Klenkia soli TaxID=1052260 RepID=A0A1H0RQA4_9ACTN|nr:hypothetical protein [Klenkia soli]SDP31674.1 hypothetical protein SAMN05660199_03595 [Klenkia soli]